MIPFGMFGGVAVSPFDDVFEPIDPRSLFASMKRPLLRMERRMDRELGKMLSSVQEDDKAFQVSQTATYKVIQLNCKFYDELLSFLIRLLWMFLISNPMKLPSRRLTRTLSFTVRFIYCYLLKCDFAQLLFLCHYRKARRTH